MSRKLKHKDFITGKTLATRTRQRNFLLLRLHGARQFLTRLGMVYEADRLATLIRIVKTEQKIDSKKTYYERKNAQ